LFSATITAIVKMDDIARILITLGVLFLCGVATDAIGRRTRLPRVTLLLILGFVIGASELDFFYPYEGKWVPVLTDIALVMVGFLLGGQFTTAVQNNQEIRIAL
jgi:Kef-type K+ transport system membrane component KefB